jgi:segregation and condensation protein B
VAVAPATLNALLERGWAEVIGQRETPGRPAIFATTKKFLDDLNLRSIEELPPLEELQSALAAAPANLVDAPPQAPEQQALIGEPSSPESEPTEPEDHAGQTPP